MINDKKYFLGWADANNMENGVREKIIDNFSKKYQLPVNILESDIQIIDGFVGEGYGMITEKEVDVIKQFAVKEGIIIDPVYTAKALLGLKESFKVKSIYDKNILFIHTGGIFGLFPHSDLFGFMEQK